MTSASTSGRARHWASWVRAAQERASSARSLLRLVPDPTGKHDRRQHSPQTASTCSTSPSRSWARSAAPKIAIVFQDPLSSLNPTLTIGFQLSEGLILHQGLDQAKAWARSIELLDAVGSPMARRGRRIPVSSSPGGCASGS